MRDVSNHERNLPHSTSIYSLNRNKNKRGCKKATSGFGGKMQNLQQVGNISGSPDTGIKPEAVQVAVWGIASAIDIYDCNPQKIRSADLIRNFVVELCELIEMKRFGDTQVVHFGEDERVAGYSMVQLIETSLISAHFANLTNTVYLDVFSCKSYDPETVKSFSQNYFGGKYSILNVTLRR